MGFSCTDDQWISLRTATATATTATSIATDGVLLPSTPAGPRAADAVRNPAATVPATAVWALSSVCRYPSAVGPDLAAATSTPTTTPGLA